MLYSIMGREIKANLFQSSCMNWLGIEHNIFRHTCIRHAKLSMTHTHFSLGISLIFAVIAAFSSPIVWGLFSYTLSLRYPPQIQIWGVQVWWMRYVSLSLNHSPSQARESFVVLGWPHILPEPLFISIYTSASSQWCPKLHQYCHIAHSWVQFNFKVKFLQSRTHLILTNGFY
jgi:hypothetical protein